MKPESVVTDAMVFAFRKCERTFLNGPFITEMVEEDRVRKCLTAALATKSDISEPHAVEIHNGQAYVIGIPDACGVQGCTGLAHPEKSTLCDHGYPPGPNNHCATLRQSSLDLVERLRTRRDDWGSVVESRDAILHNEAANEIERLRAFEKRILKLRASMIEDCSDPTGQRARYMLYGDDADVIEELEAAING